MTNSRIEYVAPKVDLYNTTSLTQFGGGGGKMFGRVLGVVAAIAIPFVAPAIAGSIFGASTIMNTALVGAGLGAAAGAGSAALSGGDIMQGALLGAGTGAIGGGVGAATQGATLFGAAGTAGGAGAGAGLSAVGADPWAGLRATGTGTGFVPNAGLTGDVSGTAGGGTGGTATLGGTSTNTSRITQSLLRATPQIAGQLITQMTGPDQAEYLAGLEREMELYKGRDEQAYQARLDLYNRFLQQADAADPGFRAQLAEAKVARNQSKQYQQNMDQLRLTGRTENELAGEARRLATSGALARHAAGVNAGLAATEERNAALSRAAGVAPQGGDPNRLAYAENMYNIAGQRSNQIAQGAANTAQLLLQPFTYSGYRLGAPQQNNNIYNTSMYG